MTPSDAYMLGWDQGATGQELNDVGIPNLVLHAFTDGWNEGHSHRQLAQYTAKGFNNLQEINRKARSLWNLDGQSLHLPDPPEASGCRFHYCWMPVDTTGDNHLCAGHGGKDAVIPKKRKS